VAKQKSALEALLKWMRRLRSLSGAGHLLEPADPVNTDAPRRPVDIFFSKDRGMVFFVAFLALAAMVLPMVPLSRVGQLTLAFIFVATLTLGAFAVIQHRAVIYLVIALATSTFTVALIAGNRPSHRLATLHTTLRVACLSILALMTLKRTLRPGRVTVYRVFGGIAGYLLIGYTIGVLLSEKNRLVTGHGQQQRTIGYCSFHDSCSVESCNVMPVAHEAIPTAEFPLHANT
jgi:hypothetical protein